MKLRYDMEKCTYRFKGKHIKLVDIAEQVREGAILDVTCGEGYDYTKELLLKLAFGRYLPRGSKLDLDPWVLPDSIIELAGVNRLYEIIRSGGVENWLLNKKRKGIQDD